MIKIEVSYEKYLVKSWSECKHPEIWFRIFNFHIVYRYMNENIIRQNYTILIDKGFSTINQFW